MLEAQFAQAVPGAECAKIVVSLITKDEELVSVTITREGFTERLKAFEED